MTEVYPFQNSYVNLVREFLLNGNRAAFTDSGGGTVDSVYGHNNLAYNVGDSASQVKRNRRQLETWAESPVVWMNQTHSDHVAVVEAVTDAVTVNADAAIVAPGLAAAVLVADCIPVLVSSDIGYQAAIHAGRRGIELDIIGKTLTRMQKLGATKLWGAIGPHICQLDYEVDSQTCKRVCHKWPVAKGVSRVQTPALDLGAVAMGQLAKFGVMVTDRDSRCTYESPELYSYRRAKITGRQCGIITSN